MTSEENDELGCCGHPLPLTPPVQETPRTTLLVVAAVLIQNNQALCAQRPANKDNAFKWEFPGGKIEPGEMPEYALVRELHEELGIVTCTDCLQPVTFASHDYGDKHVLMPVYAIRKWRGTITPRDGQHLRFVNKHDLPKLDWIEADKPLIPFIQDLL